MSKNLIADPVIQGEYFSQYIKHVLRYKDQTRRGVFIRYYNIDRTLMNETSTKSVLHNTDHVYNIYEYTPTLNVDEITDITELDDVSKLKFVGATSITIYTIKYPTIHDLVTFSYPPYTSNHVFRVRNISTVLRERDAGLTTFKLELEFAKNADLIDTLSINTTDVYSVFDGKNISLKLYTAIMAERVVIQNTLDNIQVLFNDYNEMFSTNGNPLTSDVFNNIQIYNGLVNNKSIQQYFTSKVPYGVRLLTGITDGDVLTYATNTVAAGVPTVSTVINIQDYTFNISTALADLTSMFSKFSG